MADILTTLPLLGRVIIALEGHGHEVWSVAYNGDIGDIVIVAKDEGWKDVVKAALGR